MRWGIRTQLLLPPVVLLVGVAVSTAWTAVAAAGRARGQIETQVRQVARTLSESDFPLTAHVLQQMKGLSGAEFVLVEPDGRRTVTLPFDESGLEGAALAEDWQSLRLGPPAQIPLFG